MVKLKIICSLSPDLWLNLRLLGFALSWAILLSLTEIRIFIQGVVVHTCYLNTGELRKEDRKFEASLGQIHSETLSQRKTKLIFIANKLTASDGMKLACYLYNLPYHNHIP